MRPAPSVVSCHRVSRRAFMGLVGVGVGAGVYGAAAQAGEAATALPVVRSHWELSMLFAERFGDRYRCRFFKNRKGWVWEARDGSKWRAVTDGEVLAAAAELGARTFYATGADGEPYPAPDVGGSMETAMATLSLASARMAAR